MTIDNYRFLPLSINYELKPFKSKDEDLNNFLLEDAQKYLFDLMAVTYLLEDVSNIDFIIFAYEPLKVKENLEVPEIQEQVEMIYHHLQDKYHSKPNIIYGGGVEQKDINDLLDNDFINGLLIGKISANIEKITKIITKVK